MYNETQLDASTAQAMKMRQLSSDLDMCAGSLIGKVVYLDYPVHGNVGDLLIFKGTQRFFHRNQVNVIGSFNINNIGSRANNLIGGCSTICFHGGGNFGDLWPSHEKLREELIEAYPNKRIVVLPQSVYFQAPGALEGAANSMSRHRDLHIFVRDNKSLEILKNVSMQNVQLCPDMAHALWDVIPKSHHHHGKALYLFRRDHEALQHEALTLKTSDMFDWDDLRRGVLSKIFRLGFKASKWDIEFGFNHLPVYGFWSLACNMVVNRAIQLFSSHGDIVTDRLHAVILALMMGHPIEAYDNSYGKISSYITCWLKDLPNLRVNMIDNRPLHDSQSRTRR